MKAALRAIPVSPRSLIIAILLLASPAPGMAETFDAVYRATLAGVPVGTARLTGDVGAGAYTIRLKGEASLLGFSNRFEAASNGASSDARLSPANYVLKTEGRSPRTVAVNFAGDRAASVSIEPQPSAAEQEGRLPIELPHLRQVLDPMSAMMTEILRASRSGNPCDGIAHVFTGSMRFDMTLVSSDRVNDEIICRAIYRPIAGHIPSRSSAPTAVLIAYPAAARVGELRLPVRFEIPAPIGTVTIRRTS
ncbi:MAG: DUF3108 domain-containing protein [Tardiphaga sp.]